MVFPEHKAGLALTHNEHMTLYQTVEQAVAEADELQRFQWVSAEQRAKALETGSLWVLQWYPDTPVGFYALAAADLGALLDAATARDLAAL